LTQMKLDKSIMKKAILGLILSLSQQ